jgi:GT2 family glycosyltransferase
MLDRVLLALAAQQDAPRGWGVTVVDNNSPDDTRLVVTRHVDRATIPGLRRIVETEQGLTPARLRGVHSTDRPWIAFVDDDCILDPRWIASALSFARANPDCGGFGGRVRPEYGGSPPKIIDRYGWAFAEQDLGEQPETVDCLVGAGMVLNRDALRTSGWPAGPYFADRVGRRLVSGGDVEIALRVAATGRPLWYAPDCTLQHVIPAGRTTTNYLVRMTRGLGVSYSLAQALLAPGSVRAWIRTTAKDLIRSLVGPLKATRRVFRGRDARIDAALTASYELGRWIGVARVLRLLALRRCDFFGRARPPVSDGSERADAVRAD